VTSEQPSSKFPEPRLITTNLLILISQVDLEDEIFSDTNLIESDFNLKTISDLTVKSF
jgi:hypothetical protein